MQKYLILFLLILFSLARAMEKETSNELPENREYHQRFVNAFLSEPGYKEFVFIEHPRDELSLFFQRLYAALLREVNTSKCETDSPDADHFQNALIKVPLDDHDLHAIEGKPMSKHTLDQWVRILRKKQQRLQEKMVQLKNPVPRKVSF